MTAAWKKDRDASRLQTPRSRGGEGEDGRPAERREGRRRRRRRGRRGGGDGENAGDTEGTCYALRDMAEARGIHNFVKTKMLRSCHGGVAFFLVSRNVQPRLSLCPSFPGCPLRPFVSPSFSSTPPSPPSGLSLSLRSLPPFSRCPPCPSYRRASSLSRFSGNAPRNEKRFVKNVSASS